MAEFARPEGNRQPITNEKKKGSNKMAQNPPQKTPPARPAPAQAAAPQARNTAATATPATNGAEDGKGEKVKRPKVSFVSAQMPGFSVRMYREVADKFGPPKDPQGNVMIARAKMAGGAGISKEAREAKAKEREAKLAAMSAPEKEAFLAAERAERDKKRKDRSARKYESLYQKVLQDLASMSPAERESRFKELAAAKSA